MIQQYRLEAASEQAGKLQARLLILAALFLALEAATITLAPAVRARSWSVGLRWGHWFAFLAWIIIFTSIHFKSRARLPGADPYIIPVTGLLCGWGLMTIWRLSPDFGARQTVWLIVSALVLIFGIGRSEILAFLRRYKYIWLTSGLLLTALTFLFGTNPSGAGSPRLWLGCCGFYMQPSEPLKLLLIVYLAAYLADRGVDMALSLPFKSTALLPLLAPTLMMAGMVGVLLVGQRDLGTASIFLFLYTSMVYIGSGQRRILVASGIFIMAAGLAGYVLFDVVRLRVDAWINPWLDPSGRSFQIIQALIALANGGSIGRGPGLGNPGLVPVSHSDFILTAISEESGLIGALGLILLIAMLVSRGMIIALQARDPFRRFLAAGLTAYITGQSILIIGGNLRLLPLTGVTLPFVSYGGSSLVTSFCSLLLILLASGPDESHHSPLLAKRPYLELSGVLIVGLTFAGLLAGWWMVVRAPALVTRTDNPRRAINDRYVMRGAILDRHNAPIVQSNGPPGALARQMLYPALSNIIGYTDPVFGQAGLEASLDPFLRGVQGTPALSVWTNHLLYGQPPPGLDVRLSLDLNLEHLADASLGERPGAVVVLNAISGEIIAMASHPTFNANHLQKDWAHLVNDPSAPLLNRATQGLYPPGAALGALLFVDALDNGISLPNPPPDQAYVLDGNRIDCATPRDEETWQSVIRAGCPGAVARLGEQLGSRRLVDLYERLGLFTDYHLDLPVRSQPISAFASIEGSTAGDLALGKDFNVSPLQIALAAATISSGGIRPAPILANGVKTAQSDWIVLPVQDQPVAVFSGPSVIQNIENLSIRQAHTWTTAAVGITGAGPVSWYLAGGLPASPVTSAVVVVVLLEGQDPIQAQHIGEALLEQAGQQAP